MCKVVSSSSKFSNLSNLHGGGVEDECVELPSNSCRSCAPSSSKSSNLDTARECNPASNTPLAKGPVNYVAVSDSSPCDVGLPTSQTGDVGPSASATGECVAACNSCLSQGIDIDIVSDTHIDTIDVYSRSNISEDKTEEVREGRLSHAVNESHSRHVDRQSFPQCGLRGAGGSHNRPSSIQSHAQTDKGSSAPELYLRDHLKGVQQALAASRATGGSIIDGGEGQESTVVGKLHGAVEPLNLGGVRRLLEPREILTTPSGTYGTPRLEHAYQLGVPGTAGSASTTSGDGCNGFGLPERARRVGAAAGIPFLPTPVRDIGAQKEGRYADARTSQQPQEGQGRTDRCHDVDGMSQPSPSIRQKVEPCDSRSVSLNGEVHGVNSSHNKWSRTTYPSRGGEATLQTGVSASQIPALAEYLNSDVLSNSVQNSAANDGDLVCSDLITNSVQNSGGLRQTDTVAINVNANDDSGLSILQSILSSSIRTKSRCLPRQHPTGKLSPFEISAFLEQNQRLRRDTLGLGELVDSQARGQSTSNVDVEGFGESYHSQARGQSSSNVDAEALGESYHSQARDQNASVCLGSISQVWHVGTCKNSSVRLVGDVLEKKIVRPSDNVAAGRLTKWMFSTQKLTDVRHVMLVRGSCLVAGGRGERHIASCN